jgi:hypothetical protein
MESSVPAMIVLRHDFFMEPHVVAGSTGILFATAKPVNQPGPTTKIEELPGFTAPGAYGSAQAGAAISSSSAIVRVLLWLGTFRGARR